MNISFMRSLILGCLSGSLFLGVALADYHYASHTGSDEYPYTSWETAADSIQPAINAAESGDTTYVGSGIWQYAQSCTLWEGRALIGMGIDSTIIRNDAQFLHFLYTRNNVHIEGFTFDAVNHPTGSIAIYCIYDTNVTILNNRFANLRTAILAVITGRLVNNLFIDNWHALGADYDACSLLVKNNTITGCSEAGILANDGSWFVENNIFHHNPGDLNMLMLNFHRPQDTAYIANNLFYKNQWRSPYVQSSAIALVGEAAINNIFVGPEYLTDQSAIFVGETPGGYLALSQNNAISHLYAAFRHSLGAEVNIAYTNIWQVTRNDMGWGQAHYLEGNLFSNPMFADTNDLHLQAFSPLIDAGDPNILDVDGTRSDIGVYGGPGGESYQYLDLPPQIPDSIAYRVWNDTIYFDWRGNYEADFFGYMLHRDVVSGFTPSLSNLIAEPESALYSDGDVVLGETYYYRIASIDSQGNRSDYSPEIAVMVTGIEEGVELPRMTVIESNYPNPFNEQAIINYYLADIGYQPAVVKLTICDIGGRMIKTLVDARQYPGSYRVDWDGRDEGGEAASSGIYFARLSVSGIELCRARKIVLLR